MAASWNASLNSVTANLLREPRPSQDHQAAAERAMKEAEEEGVRHRRELQGCGRQAALTVVDPNGERPRQTRKNNMGSARAKPGESPRQTQNINKGSARAKPKGMATKPRRSIRLTAEPASPPTSRDTRTRRRTVNSTDRSSAAGGTTSSGNQEKE